MEARTRDFVAAEKGIQAIEKMSNLGPLVHNDRARVLGEAILLDSWAGMELLAFVASERFDAGDKDGARDIVREMARKIDNAEEFVIDATLTTLASAQIKLGEIAAAAKTINKIKVEGRHFPLPPGEEKSKEMVEVEKYTTASARVVKARALAELSTAQVAPTTRTMPGSRSAPRSPYSARSRPARLFATTPTPPFHSLKPESATSTPQSKPCARRISSTFNRPSNKS